MGSTRLCELLDVQLVERSADRDRLSSSASSASTSAEGEASTAAVALFERALEAASGLDLFRRERDAYEEERKRHNYQGMPPFHKFEIGALSSPVFTFCLLEVEFEFFRLIQTRRAQLLRISLSIAESERGVVDECLRALSKMLNSKRVTYVGREAAAHLLARLLPRGDGFGWTRTFIDDDEVDGLERLLETAGTIRILHIIMGFGRPDPGGPGTHKKFLMGGHPQSFGRKSKRKWKLGDLHILRIYIYIYIYPCKMVIHVL